MNGARVVRGRIDAGGRLVEADPPLAELQRGAGGSDGGLVAIPALAALARRAGRLGISLSRPITLARGENDLDLWVEAEPEAEGVALILSEWRERPPRPASANEDERQADIERSVGGWRFETDAELRLAALSPHGLAEIGEPPAALVGKELTALFRLEEGEEGIFPILAALAAQRPFEGQRARLRGSGRCYLLAGVPLRDGAGAFAGYRATAAPAPDQMSPSVSAPASGAFARRLDRALRGPLDRIVADAETIRAGGKGERDDSYAGYAADIAAAGRHLLGLVDDLVDLQAIERSDFSPEVEDVDLAEVGRRAAGLLGVRANEAEVGIDAPAENERLPARGDFRRALQIVMNLLTNAIRYSPEGSKIWIRLEEKEGHAALTVADQGKGIAEQDLERIFDKFERVDPAEPGGTGLGLYIARRLARAMDGDLLVDSAPGQGARFTLVLPGA
ncbi:MAG: ATP-binding protein [Sphingomonadaceae bacterium]